MNHTTQLMSKYVPNWEWCSAWLATMDAPLDDGLLVKICSESSSGRSKWQYGAALSALLTKNYLTWQAPMLRLLQKYSSQHASRSASHVAKGTAYVASSGNNNNKKAIKKDSNEVKFWYCRKNGDYLDNCRKDVNEKGQSRHDNFGRAGEPQDNDKMIIAVLLRANKSRTRRCWHNIPIM